VLATDYNLLAKWHRDRDEERERERERKRGEGKRKRELSIWWKLKYCYDYRFKRVISDGRRSADPNYGDQ